MHIKCHHRFWVAEYYQKLFKEGSSRCLKGSAVTEIMRTVKLPLAWFLLRYLLPETSAVYFTRTLKRGNMKSYFAKKCVICLIIFIAFMFALLSLSHAEQDVVTLVGEINDTGQLVAEGDIFDIEPTDLGNDLVQNYISLKVKVECTIREGEELKIITVKSFQAVDE